MRAGNPGPPVWRGTSGLPEPGTPGLPEVQVASRYLACRHLQAHVPLGFQSQVPRDYLQVTPRYPHPISVLGQAL